MKNIFRFLSGFKKWIILIILLLIAQAYCELSLPNYTSNILNVGLQQGGIEDAVPDTIRGSSLSALELLIPDEDVEIVNRDYGVTSEEQLKSESILTLAKDADREELLDILLIPEVVIYQLSQADTSSQEVSASGNSADAADISQSDVSSFSLDQLEQAIDAGLITKEQILDKMSEQMSQMEGMTDTYLSQIAVYYVTGEYEAQGVDMNALRSSYLWSVGFKMILMSVLMLAASILAGLIASVVSASIGKNIRHDLYNKVMSFTSGEMEHFSTASLITRCTNDIQQIQMVTVLLLRMVMYAPILAIFGIIRVLQTDVSMSWIIVLAVVVIAIFILTLVGIAMPKFKIMQTLVDRLNLVSREMLTGIMPIRAFSRETYEEERFDKASTDLYKTQLFTNRTMAFMAPVMMFVMNGISVLIVWIGASGVDKGTVQVGDLTAFITYSMVIVASFLMLSMISIILPRAGVAADRITEVLNTDIVLQDPGNPRDCELKDIRGEIAFQNVSFRYPGADEPAISGISFRAEPGKTTAIIGSTGSGKSTLLNLIPRFYDVSEGSITLDGIDIREITQEKLRESLGYVPQKGILFSGTIESNLKYGGSQISDDDIREAAGIAQAEEFISRKEEGYDASIAQGGTNVSGGQRQRLSIARAIAKHPKVYLFDDSFSALDFKTDLALRKALGEKTGDAAVIIVAQRISTILHADQIIVMNDGQIAGIGKHEYLLETCETYQEIAKSQLSEKELEQLKKRPAEMAEDPVTANRIDSIENTKNTEKAEKGGESVG